MGFVSSLNYMVRYRKKTFTYIVFPYDFIGPGVWMHIALKIHVIALFDVIRIEI